MAEGKSGRSGPPVCLSAGLSMITAAALADIKEENDNRGFLFPVLGWFLTASACCLVYLNGHWEECEKRVVYL